MIDPYEKAKEKAEKHFEEFWKKQEEEERRRYTISWGICPECGSDLIQKRRRGLFGELLCKLFGNWVLNGDCVIESKCNNCGFYDKFVYIAEDGLS